MNGVISLLDDAHERMVEALWRELEATFGVRGVYVTPYPHFSYQIAEQYDDQKLAAALAQLASTQSPFTIRTAGLGVFTGTKPVLYIPVARDGHLSAFHFMVCDAIKNLGAGVSPYYANQHWMPHITIGFGDIDAAKLGDIVRYLAARSFDWEIPIDNLAYINVQNGKQTLKSRFTLST